MADETTGDSQHFETARSLGAFSAMMAALPDGKSPIGPASLRQAANWMETDQGKPFSHVFRAGRDSAARRSAQLGELIARSRDKSADQRLLLMDAKRKQLDTLTVAIKQGSAELEKTKLGHREDIRVEEKRLAELVQRRSLIEKEQTKAARGHRAAPRPPRKPDNTRGLDRKDGPPKAITKAEKKYERALDQYKEEVAHYKRRLAESNAQDQERRREISIELEALKAEIKQVELAREERRRVTADRRKELQTQEGAASNLRLEAHLLSKQGDDFAAAAFAVQLLPSNYDLLSYAAEQKRIGQMKPR